MKTFGTIIPIFVAVGASTALAGTVAPRDSTFQSVTVKGNAFFAGKDRFYIRGVDYQPGKKSVSIVALTIDTDGFNAIGGSSDLVDPIANADTCKRDIAE